MQNYPPEISSQHSNHFSVKFWGVRGTMPVADAAFSKFGGNTSCVEVNCGRRRLILDAGTGLVNLGNQLVSCGEPIDILLSHTHIDHILGLLFFPQLYEKSEHIRIWAGHLMPEMTLMDALCRLISPPLFPIHLRGVACNLEAIDFHAGESLPYEQFANDGIQIHTLPLNHPDRATGYRIEYNGKSVCYITDIEHVPDQFEPRLVDFIKNTDLLIYDSTYDDDEFSKYQGWGHSTWQYAVQLAQKANVKQLSLFHHDPSAHDIILDQRQNILNSSFESMKVSVENSIIVL